MAQPHRTCRRRSHPNADRDLELVGTMKRPRQKSETHLDFVRSLPCLICGDNTSTEAAHIRMGDASIAKRPTGMGEKPSDRKSTRLNSSHLGISYAVFCLKKKS